MAASSRNDLMAGGLFVVIGLYFAIEALGYEIGSPLRMGPGFAPLALGCVLVLLGLAIAIAGLRKAADAAGDPVPWRAIALIVAAILFFGLTVRGLGFAVTVFVTVFATALASRVTKPLGAAAIALGLTALSAAIFVYGLRLQVPLFGPWLPV